MKDIVFGLFGGLALFIFGMKYLSDGLQKIASNKLKFVMTKITNNHFLGMLIGAFVTGIVQSSGLITIILIGFIDSGILTFMQSISILLGANIGTTVTAQIIAFNISEYALPMIGIGMMGMLVFKKEKFKFLAQALFSVGILFLGLKFLSEIVGILKNIPNINNYFIILSKNPFLGIILGIIMTAILQSSSVSIGILIAFASSGLIDLKTSMYVILGDNIGSTFTAWLSSIGGNIEAKRLSLFHTLSKIIGTIYFYFFIMSGLYEKLINLITPGNLDLVTMPRYIANAHTLFNIINSLIFYPFIGIIAKFIEKIMPGKNNKYLSNSLKYLQNSLLETPELAFNSSKKEISEMSKMTTKILNITFKGFLEKDIYTLEKIYKKEDEIDKLQHDITIYLSKIANESMTLDMSSSLPVLIHSINDIERISDHAVNIVEITEKMIENNIVFSLEAMDDLKKVFDIINIMSEKIDKVLESFGFTEINILDVKDILSLENTLDKIHKELFDSQSKRIIDLKCSPEASILFIDIMNNLERIGDHLENIAEAAMNNFSLLDINKMK